MIQHDLLITIVATITLGVLAQVIAERTKLPSIIYLLSLGVFFGPDILNIVQPSLLKEGLYALTALSIAVILFEGGLTLEIRNVRQVSTSVFNLITIGAVVTWGGATLVSWLLLEISWTAAVLFGTLVIVTGPTVIGPLLRAVKVRRDIRTILKWEGILIDPVGAIIAVLVLGFVTVEGQSLLDTVIGFIGRILVGTAIGLITGFLMTRVMRLKLTETISTLVILAAVFFMFGISELIIKESGIMSVTIAGIVMGNMKVPNLHNVKGFKEKLTILMVSTLFVLLAANLRLKEIEYLGWNGVFVVLCLMFIVRPLNIWSSVRNPDITLRDKLFLSWVAPRGIIAAAVATLFSITLQAHGYPKASLLSSLTFLTIAITVIVQGFTARPIARFLKVLQTGSHGILILGGNQLAIAFARELKQNDIPVAILDSNPRNLVHADRDKITTFVGDVLKDEAWDEIDLTSYGYFLAATSNNELNSLACGRAANFFERDHIHQIRNGYKNEKQPFTLEMIGGNQNYDLSVDIIGVSGELRSGLKRVVTATPKEMEVSTNSESVLLGAFSGDEVIFSTDPETLRRAEKVIRLLPA